MPPLYFLLGNLVATLLLPPLTACALLLLITEGMGLDISWLCSLTDLLYNLLDGSALLIGRLPGALQSGIYIPWYSIIPYAAALLMLRYWLVTRRRQALLTSGLLLVATAGCMIAGLSAPDDGGRLYLARSKQFTALVADGGGSRLDVIVANRDDSLEASNTLRSRYADFMGRRGIDSLHIVPFCNAEGPGYRLTGNLLQWGNHRLAIVGRPILLFWHTMSIRAVPEAGACSSIRSVSPTARCATAADGRSKLTESYSEVILRGIFWPYRIAVHHHDIDIHGHLAAPPRLIGAPGLQLILLQNPVKFVIIKRRHTPSHGISIVGPMPRSGGSGIDR